MTNTTICLVIRFLLLLTPSKSTYKKEMLTCRCTPSMTCVYTLLIGPWSRAKGQDIASSRSRDTEKWCALILPTTFTKCLGARCLITHQVWVLLADPLLSYSSGNLGSPSEVLTTLMWHVLPDRAAPKWAKSYCNQGNVNGPIYEQRPRGNRMHCFADKCKVLTSVASAGRPAVHAQLSHSSQ